jgi:RNA recognition motif-containing protein
VTDIFSGQCKGFGFIRMEGHEVHAAIVSLDDKDFCGNRLKVGLEVSRSKHRKY